MGDYEELNKPIDPMTLIIVISVIAAFIAILLTQDWATEFSLSKEFKETCAFCRQDNISQVKPIEYGLKKCEEIIFYCDKYLPETEIKGVLK